MEYVLKIYSNQTSSSPFNTVENINNIAFNRDLNNFSTLEIDVPINVSGLSQFNKVELCIAWDDIDTVEFWGYIHNIKPTNGKITLECRDYKALFLKKLVLSDKDFVWVTISSAMNEILADWKALTNDERFFSTNYTTVFTKKILEWDNIFDVLDELADLSWCVRKVEGNTIYFDTLIWTDKSIPSSSDFFELVYNGEDLTENNIDTIETETYSTLSNLVIGKDKNGKVTLKDDASILSIGVFAEYKSFREWDLTTNTQNYLDLKKNEQKTFRIKGKKNIWDDLYIWDKIHLRVENINEYLNIETDVFIIWKEVSIENGTKIINLTLSEIYAKLDTFTRKINNISKEINLLSL